MDEAVIVNRPIDFEEDGNYVIVGVRHAGKSYLLYQRVRQLQAAGKGWDEILFVDFEDERLAEFQTEDFNSLLEAHLELYGKKPVVFWDEDWKCLLITYDEEGTEEGIPVVPVWKWLMEV